MEVLHTVILVVGTLVAVAIGLHACTWLESKTRLNNALARAALANAGVDE